MLLLLLPTLLTLICRVETYSRGAPNSQCHWMTPKHGFQPQISPSPASIAVADLAVASDERVLVSLKSSRGLFKGFMMRAENVRDRKGTGTNMEEAIGAAFPAAAACPFASS